MSRHINWILTPIAIFSVLGVSAMAGKRDRSVPIVPTTLKIEPIPEPENLDEFVRDRIAAQRLGKALFWDMQVGSDGQSCASCHFQAGADPRVINQLSPGLNRVFDPTGAPDPDTSFGNEFGVTRSGATAGPNYTLVPRDFPFHELKNPKKRNSEVLFDMNDGASSQGTRDGTFNGVTATSPTLRQSRAFNASFDVCQALGMDIFHLGGTQIRRVEPRNTPTTINAVFNHRNFWDGRASDIFNGVDPFGRRSATAAIWVVRGGSLVSETVRINNASLASQAVGPPLSDFEMSCAGRTFPDIGFKMVTRRPLAMQDVHPDDSLLASLRHRSGRGLTGTYERMIKAAFRPKFWNSSELVTIGGEPYSQMEANFSLFWGLAIQLYEATLVSNDAKFDQVQERRAAFTREEQKGLEIFMGRGKCINCHMGPVFTGATVQLRQVEPEAIERMVMGDGGVAVYDGGFYNIGVRPTFEDLGLGANLLGFPLSFARQEVNGPKIDEFNFDPDRFEVPGDIVLDERVAVDGAFKVPTLRNSELTGPYFHNGGTATLMQVVEFYNRGGDRRDVACGEEPRSTKSNKSGKSQKGNAGGDSTGFGDACSNLDPDIEELHLSRKDKENLVRFLLTLTDERVRQEAAPFDHPQLFVPNGHEANGDDIVIHVPAIGRRGRAAEGLRPVGTFLGLDPLDDPSRR